MRFTNAISGTDRGQPTQGGAGRLLQGALALASTTSATGRRRPPISHGVFAGHGTYDMVVAATASSRSSPAARSGGSWSSPRAARTTCVEGNVIENIGEIEGDGVPRINAPEIMLTESYRLSYEGKAMAVLGRRPGARHRVACRGRSPARRRRLAAYRPGRRPVAAGRAAARPDDCAGRYRRSRTGREHVSIARGFVNERFVGNRDRHPQQPDVDLHGASRGNHFGLGRREEPHDRRCAVVRLRGLPTESPVGWGWSHAPVLGAVVRGNIFEDSETGAETGGQPRRRHVQGEHGAGLHVGGRRGRTGAAGPAPFLARREVAEPPKQPLRGLTFGDRAVAATRANFCFRPQEHARRAGGPQARPQPDRPLGRMNKKPILEQDLQPAAQGENRDPAAPSPPRPPLAPGADGSALVGVCPRARAREPVERRERPCTPERRE